MSKIRITDNEKIKAIESYIQGEMELFATSYIPQSSGGCLKNPGPHF